MSEDGNQKRLAEERKRRLAEEKVKRMLHDRTIGGHAPRPSREFIENCTGPLKTNQEIEKQAQERAEREVKRQQELARNKAEKEKSIREHNERLAQQKKMVSEQKAKDRALQVKNEFERSNGR